MSLLLPVAQISPGIGALEGILILLVLISVFLLLVALTIACGVQTWRLFRSGNRRKERWLASTIVSFVLLLGLTGGCLWVVTPKPLPQFTKCWDFTRSHGLDVIGEQTEQDTFTYTGRITVQFLLPNQRSLSVLAQNVVVKCEQGQVKEIEVLIPGLKSMDDVREQGKTILRRLNFAPALIDRWQNGYPGFGWTEIKGGDTEPEIDMEGDYDNASAETTVIIWITWKN